MRAVLTSMFILALTVGFAAPVFADTVADQTAVVKDDVAVEKSQTDIERDRAQKAEDKSNGNWAGQAVDSVALGYDHVFHTEKKGEQSTDNVIANHDQ